MRTRMLTPFVSATIASVFLLAAMFAWNGMRNEGMLSSFEPTAVMAEVSAPAQGEDVAITFEVTPTTVILGESTTFSATTEVTNTGTYTMSWDYGDGIGSNGPVEFTDAVAGVTDTYTYVAPDIYNATASISQTATVSDELTTDPIAVTVTGPDVTIPTDATFGENVTVNISNFSANAITGTNLVISTPMGVEVVEVLAGDIAADGTAESSAIFDEAGLYTVTATLYPETGFDLVEGPGTEVIVEQEITVAEPGASLTATPSTVTAGESVTFDAEVTGVITSAVTDYEIDFGDGSSDTLTTGALSATTVYTYSMEGNYTALFTTTLIGGAVYTDTASVVVSSDVVTGGSLTLNADPTTLTAGSTDISTVVATILDSNNAPAANQPVTITIDSPVYGMRLTGGTTVVSGTTDASGAYTTTLTVGAVPGEVTLTASSPAAALDGTVVVTANPAGGGASATQAVTLSGTDDNVATFDVGGRQIIVSLPAQPDLPGVTLYLNISETVGATDVPSGTVVIYDFSLNVFAGQDIPALSIEEGDQIPTPPTGFAADGAQVTVIYTDEELETAGTSLAQNQALSVNEDTLALYDTVSPDGTGDLSDEPLNSTVDADGNTVTGDVDQFGRHALAGQAQATIYLPVITQ
jgi:hypothetical protein